MIFGSVFDKLKLQQIAVTLGSIIPPVLTVRLRLNLVWRPVRAVVWVHSCIVVYTNMIPSCTIHDGAIANQNLSHAHAPGSICFARPGGC